MPVQFKGMTGIYLWSLRVVSPPTSMFLGVRKKPENLEKSQNDMGKQHTDR